MKREETWPSMTWIVMMMKELKMKRKSHILGLHPGQVLVHIQTRDPGHQGRDPDQDHDLHLQVQVQVKVRVQTVLDQVQDHVLEKTENEAILGLGPGNWYRNGKGQKVAIHVLSICIIKCIYIVLITD